MNNLSKWAAGLVVLSLACMVVLAVQSACNLDIPINDLINGLDGNGDGVSSGDDSDGMMDGENTDDMDGMTDDHYSDDGGLGDDVDGMGDDQYEDVDSMGDDGYVDDGMDGMDDGGYIDNGSGEGDVDTDGLPDTEYIGSNGI